MFNLNAFLVFALVTAGQIRGGPSMSTDRLVSSSVVASFISHTEYSVGHFTLLVLWRGRPGWSAPGKNGGNDHSSGSGSSGDVSGSYQWLSYGGLTMGMELDWKAATVRILDRELSLKDTNVVLVDFVDNPGGGVIVGTRYIGADPSAQGNPIDGIAAIVRSSQELFEYLRCDIKHNDSLIQYLQTMSCDQMRPQ